MRRQGEPLFLARRSYRRRRLEDAARLIPILGFFLFFLPLMAPSGRTAWQGLYLFFGWLILIIFSAIVSRGLKRWPDLWRDPNLPPQADSTQGTDHRSAGPGG